MKTQRPQYQSLIESDSKSCKLEFQWPQGAWAQCYQPFEFSKEVIVWNYILFLLTIRRSKKKKKKNDWELNLVWGISPVCHFWANLRNCILLTSGMITGLSQTQYQSEWKATLPGVPRPGRLEPRQNVSPMFVVPLRACLQHQLNQPH